MAALAPFRDRWNVFSARLSDRLDRLLRTAARWAVRTRFLADLMIGISKPFKLKLLYKNNYTWGANSL